jgi:hypothetical protein
VQGGQDGEFFAVEASEINFFIQATFSIPLVDAKR